MRLIAFHFLLLALVLIVSGRKSKKHHDRDCQNDLSCDTYEDSANDYAIPLTTFYQPNYVPNKPTPYYYYDNTYGVEVQNPETVPYTYQAPTAYNGYPYDVNSGVYPQTYNQQDYSYYSPTYGQQYYNNYPSPYNQQYYSNYPQTYSQQYYSNYPQTYSQQYYSNYPQTYSQQYSSNYQAPITERSQQLLQQSSRSPVEPKIDESHQPAQKQEQHVTPKSV